MFVLVKVDEKNALAFKCGGYIHLQALGYQLIVSWPRLKSFLIGVSAGVALATLAFAWHQNGEPCNPNTDDQCPIQDVF